MEKEIDLPILGGPPIRGIIRLPPRKPTDIAILVPGIFGRKSDELFQRGARELADRGIATVRFDFFGHQEIVWPDHGMAVHNLASAVDSIVRHVGIIWARPHLIAHSFGGIITLLSNLSLAGSVVLWDPSRDAGDIFRSLEYDKSSTVYRVSEVRPAIRTEAALSLRSVPPIPQLVSKVRNPILFVAAEHGSMPYCEPLYMRNANEPKQLVVIRGANHAFEGAHVEKTIWEQSAAWLKRF